MMGWATTGAIVILTALIGYGASAAPIAGTSRDVAGWTLSAHDKAGGHFAYCTAARSQGGHVVQIGQFESGNWAIGLTNRGWALRAGAKLDVSVFVDSAGPFRLTGTVVTPTLVATDLPSSGEILDLLRKGQTLTLQVGRDRLGFALSGSAAALDEVARCKDRYMAAAAGQQPPAPTPPAAPPAPASAAGAMPPEVSAAVAEWQKNCRMMNKAPPPIGDYVTRVDLTGDGIDDWVMSAGGIFCAGFSGTGGSGMQIFVGTADGHAREAFERYTFGMEIKRGSGSAPVVWIVVGGGACGDNRNVARAFITKCEVPLVWNRAAQRFDEGRPAPGR